MLRPLFRLQSLTRTLNPSFTPRLSPRFPLTPKMSANMTSVTAADACPRKFLNMFHEAPVYMTEATIDQLLTRIIYSSCWPLRTSFNPFSYLISKPSPYRSYLDLYIPPLIPYPTMTQPKHHKHQHPNTIKNTN